MQTGTTPCTPSVPQQPASPETTFAVVLATDRLLSELADYLADPTPSANAALMQVVDDVYEKLENAFEPLGITPLARRRLATYVLTDAGETVLDTCPAEPDDPYRAACECPCHGCEQTAYCTRCFGCDRRSVEVP